MLTLNIFPGISRFELLNLLSKARKDATWDSLRLVGLHAEDVVIVKPILLQFLAERHRHEEEHINHKWYTLLVFWLVPSMELESFIHEIFNLQIFNSIYFKCPNTTSPLPPGTSPNTSLPLSILTRAISSPSIEKLTFCNTHFSSEDTKLLCDEVRRRDYCTLPPSSRLTMRNLTNKLRTLEFVTCSFGEGAFHYIGNAIRALTSLDTLKLWYNELSYNDQIYLLSCLFEHPSLTRFDWMERVAATAPPARRTESNSMDIDGGAFTPILQIKVGPSLEEGLDSVLSSASCHIRVLGLSVGSLAVVGSLFSRLARNDSVEWLDLSYNGNAAPATNNAIAEAQVFQNLYKFQRLRNLDLFCTRLSATAFRSMIVHPVPTLEHISCWGDDLWEGSPTDHAETILEILETHPSFVEFYGGLHWRTVQVQFLFDIRRVYRRHACSDKNNKSHSKTGPCEEEETILPGLWPLILERANRILSSDLRRSRALYWLLHQGPAFSALPLNHPCSSRNAKKCPKQPKT